MAKRVKLAEYIERKNAAEGIIVELADGGEVTVPPAEMWPDAAFAALDKGKVADAVKLILGAEYEAFTKAGGNWRILNGIVAEQQGIDAPQSDASSTS